MQPSRDSTLGEARAALDERGAPSIMVGIPCKGILFLAGACLRIFFAVARSSKNFFMIKLIKLIILCLKVPYFRAFQTPQGLVVVSDCN